MNTSLIITISILLLIMIIFLIAASPRRRVSNTRKAQLYQDFARIYSQVVSDEPAVRRDSFIKMDSILSKALQFYFSNDDDCGTNLKSAKKLFSKKLYNDIWEAHKVRNSVVHDNMEVSKEETQKAFDVYKMSLVKILK